MIYDESMGDSPSEVDGQGHAGPNEHDVLLLLGTPFFAGNLLRLIDARSVTGVVSNLPGALVYACCVIIGGRSWWRLREPRTGAAPMQDCDDSD